MAAMNELPSHLCDKHMILTGLWYGEEKPKMNTFLKPLFSELVKLGSHGLCVGNVCRKVLALFHSADAPARNW